MRIVLSWITLLSVLIGIPGQLFPHFSTVQELCVWQNSCDPDIPENEEESSKENTPLHSENQEKGTHHQHSCIHAPLAIEDNRELLPGLISPTSSLLSQESQMMPEEPFFKLEKPPLILS